MSVPHIMQAWKCQVGHPSPLRVQVPVPTPGPQEVLLKVLAMGVCHSDCTILGLKEPIFGTQREFILGHEGVGEIVQLGSKVNEQAYKIGDRVGVYLTAGCHQPDCVQCSHGLSELCKAEGGHYGIGRNGIFAEYVVIHSRAAVPIPSTLDSKLAAISADAVLTAYHATKVTANLKPGDTIAIYGLGGLGINALQTALHLGVDPSRIFVIEKRQDGINQAIALGIPTVNAFCTSSAGARPFHEVMADRKMVIDTCIDLVGHSETVLSAQMVLRPGGTLVLVGLLSEQAPLLPLLTVPKGLVIRGSYNGSRESYEESLELLARGILKPKVVTESVEGLPSVLERLDKGLINGRMVLLPSWSTGQAVETLH